MNRTSLLRMGIAVLLAAAGSAYADQDQQQESTSTSVPEAANQGTHKNFVEKIPLLRRLHRPRTPSQGTNQTAANPAPPPALQRRNPRYGIEKSDVLALDFPFTPEFNETVTVQPDGYISLRGLADMHVEGKTLPELNQDLRVAYAKILHDPIIAVTLQAFESPYFIATGEVGKPGKYDLHGDTTVLQGLAVAGGLIASSKHSQVLLVRRVSSDWLSVKEFNLKHMFSAKDLQEDVFLQPGDMIFVPKNFISKIQPFMVPTAIALTPLVLALRAY